MPPSFSARSRSGSSHNLNSNEDDDLDIHKDVNVTHKGLEDVFDDDDDHEKRGRVQPTRNRQAQKVKSSQILSASRRRKRWMAATPGL